MLIRSYKIRTRSGPLRVEVVLFDPSVSRYVFLGYECAAKYCGYSNNLLHVDTATGEVFLSSTDIPTVLYDSNSSRLCTSHHFAVYRDRAPHYPRITLQDVEPVSSYLVSLAKLSGYEGLKQFIETTTTWPQQWQVDCTRV